MNPSDKLRKSMKEYRHNKKWTTQEELAKKTGLTRTIISNIECGHQQIYLEQAVAIARAIGFSLDKLE